MRAVNAADKSDDRARRLLDYRNYHRYEIEIVPADRPDAPPIQLSRSGRNLSGGEGQVPFSSRCWLRSAGAKTRARTHLMGLRSRAERTRLKPYH